METGRQLFLHYSHSLLLTARDPAKAKSAATALKRLLPSTTQTITTAPLDVSSEQSITHFLQNDLSAAVESHPNHRITLINNAGVYQRPWPETFATNVRGPILLSKGFLNIIGERGGTQNGRIINLTSGLGNAANISHQTIANLQKQLPTLDDVLKWENNHDNSYNLSKHLLNYASEILATDGADVGVEVWYATRLDRQLH